MVSAILCPIGTIQCMPGTTVCSRNRKHSKTSVSHQFSRISSVHPNRTLALRSFSIFNFELRKRNSYIKNGLILQRLSASLGNEVAVQDPNIEVVQATGKNGGLDNPSECDKSSESGALPEDESVAAEASSSSVESKSTETITKNEIPKVLDEKLVPGATFKGRVRRIQTFGAFIDIGASTDGLVHISRLSDNFVREVGDIVSVGQEVTVRIVEANLQAGRIALSMKSSDDPSQPRQKQASDPNSAESSSKAIRSRKTPGRSRNNKREETQKSSKFHKGQILEGKVKNKNRSGAFISLPDGEEGFLRTSSNVAGDMGPKFGQPSNSGGDMGLKVGQEVSVRVLRIEKGRVELGMENEEDMDSSNMLLNPSITVSASNAFAMAFRKIPAISTVLEEKERLQKSAPEDKLEEAEDQKLEEQAEERESVVRSAGEEAAFTEEVDENIVDKGVTEIAETIKKEEGSETLETNEALTNASAEQVDDFSTLSNEQAPTSETSGKDVSEVKQDEVKVVNSTSAEITSSLENDPAQVKDTKGLEISEVKDASSINNAGALQESSTLSVEEIGSSEVKDNEMIAMDSTFADEKDVLATNPAEVNDLILDSQTSKPTSEADLKEVSSGEATNTPNNGSSWPATKTETNTNSSTNVASIAAALVKQLREETGAGMMDCKKALTETAGDLEKACEFLRKKGLASAEKKASRIAAEGRIGSYIHDSRIGVLIEVNCETDFVSRGEIFKEIVEDMAMQVAASPQVQYVSLEDVPEDIVKKEKEIELQKEDLLSKPEQIREKIVEGRIGKILGELSLLEQPYIKNDKIIVKDWIKQSIATVGENIQVRRFVRYNLGEGLQKKSQDFASEVAAQTAAKPSPSTLTEKPGAGGGAESSSVLQEDKPAVEKQTVLISAALVKQLREETGSGMMDCKKALTETGGDLEKAQEFLRKKGLASADKKSGRIAAEGRVGSYIHDSRIGVLIEVNSETDFVARGDIFKQLVEDLAMQVAACPQVQYVAIEDVPKDVTDKEREIEMQREDLLAKPEDIREKIVEGRIAKRLSELVLLEQPFIRDDSLLVKDIVKQAIASLGENIRVRRFVRYNLGEGIEKETKDLAAEIAKQTTLKT